MAPRSHRRTGSWSRLQGHARLTSGAASCTSRGHPHAAHAHRRPRAPRVCDARRPCGLSFSGPSGAAPRDARSGRCCVGRLNIVFPCATLSFLVQHCFSSQGVSRRWAPSGPRPTGTGPPGLREREAEAETRVPPASRADFSPLVTARRGSCGGAPLGAPHAGQAPPTGEAPGEAEASEARRV